MNAPAPVLLSYAFRPFFILNALFAVLAVLAWVLGLRGIGLAGLGPLWHAHEMLIGFVLAAVAGFSLTAVSVWTGRPAVHGAPLGVLVLCWLLGRLAMAWPFGLHAGVSAALDMLFPLVLLALFGREVLAARNRRNYKLVAMVALVVLLNAWYHAGIMQWSPGAERQAAYLMVHAMLLMVGLVAGRITPAFTGNWLRQHGVERLPTDRAWMAAVALTLTALVGLAATFAPAHPVTAGLAFLAALAHGLRLAQWRGLATVANPLLFVLHVAYAWLPAAYLLLGLSVSGWWVPASSALHALAMGALGSIVLAVTTRVSLGHTGRPLRAARPTVVAYCLLLLAVIGRLLAPVAGAGYMAAVELSAAFWMAAFLLFLWVYWPILTRA